MPLNTETLASVVNRLSVLTLRIWHSERAADRDELARRRVPVLHGQREELCAALDALVADVAAGRRRLPVSGRFKLYGRGCGLRQGEVFRAEPEDIDFERGPLHARCRVQVIQGRLYFALPRGRKIRTVTCPVGGRGAEASHRNLPAGRGEAAVGQAGRERKKISLLLATRFGTPSRCTRGTPAPARRDRGPPARTSLTRDHPGYHGRFMSETGSKGARGLLGEGETGSPATIPRIPLRRRPVISAPTPWRSRPWIARLKRWVAWESVGRGRSDPLCHAPAGGRLAPRNRRSR
ncbi:DUF4254 domain-containing protein [Streptomyces sp. SudanB25_2051]|uniref:DUF4254 domain-containing protein n=1 Tax=Streptomyces sp. SudanB25_2051 TaxID=3035275 RepID=UPI003F54DF47